MSYPNLERDQAQSAWEAHLDGCEACQDPTTEDFCPRGGDVLGELVTILQAEDREGVDLGLLQAAAEADADGRNYLAEAWA